MNNKITELLLVSVLASGAGCINQATVEECFYEPLDQGATIFTGKANLLLNKKVTATKHWNDRGPEFTVDGKIENPDDHWAGVPLPAKLTVDMGKLETVNGIRIIFYWSGGRTYDFFVEGSKDGSRWTTVVNQKNSKKRSTKSGFLFKIKEQQFRYLRTTITGGSSPERGAHIVEFEAYGNKFSSVKEKSEKTGHWANIPKGLHGATGSINAQYKRDKIPELNGSKSWTGTAWRGERVNAMFVVWSAEEIEQLQLTASPLKSASGNTLNDNSVKPHFLRYTKARGGIYPEILENSTTIPIQACTTRPVWIAMNVPVNVKPGFYTSKINLKSSNGDNISFDIKLEVLTQQLPAAQDWKFHLDLWQNPYSVARIHNVEPWSVAHFAKMKPLFSMLGNAGQKCVTVSLLYKPWGGQAYDAFDTMIKWYKKKDGTWKFDYSIMDKYIEFMAECGIKQQINCYSMIPWSNNFRYYDEAIKDFKSITCQPGSKQYNDHWRPFLIDFVKHLKKKGWLKRTTVAMDERPHKLMVKLLDFMKNTAPELKIASAINYAKREGSGNIFDISVAIKQAYSIDPNYLQDRIKKGMKTTFYVCCGPARPNTFPHSPPAESSWMGLHAAALGYSGFLRWAYNSWVEDPMLDTKHYARNWEAGDCFLVYPGARSSIRFEHLRDGIEVFEKICILKAKAIKSNSYEVKEALKDLNAFLARCTYKTVCKEGAEAHVKEANKKIEKLTRALK